MQKKFKYQELSGNHVWKFGDIILNADGRHLTLIEVLNRLGRNGWEVVSINDCRTGAILMKEYCIRE